MAGKKSGGGNAKQEAGRAKKEENANKVKAKEAAQREALEAADWAKGSNASRAARDEQAALKADEAARKRREKAALLAEEEEALGSGGTAQAKKAVLAANKKKGKKKKDDFSLLEDALVSAADKKAKKKRDLDKAKQEKAAQAASARTSAACAAPAVDPLLANTERMLDSNSLLDADGVVGRAANKARMAAEGSGLEGALESLSVAGAAPEIKSRKALYNDFLDRMMPQMKEEHPGLRLSQYKERIFALWKKSPENPANMVDSEP